MDSISENDRLLAWAAEKRASLDRGSLVGLETAGPAKRDLHAALATARASLAVLAQPARRSPEEGHLRDDLDLLAFARAARTADVAALVLAPDPRFGLRPDELHLLDDGFPLPILLHDLLLEPRELLWARSFGADGAWLHVGVLSDAALEGFMRWGEELKMALLCEGRSPEELARAVKAGARLVCASAFDEMGAQNLDAALELLRTVPEGVVRVVRGPVSGEAGIVALRGEVDALWICGPASMPRDTLGYLRPLVAEASQG